METWEYKYMYYCAAYVDKKHTYTAIFRLLRQMKTVAPFPYYNYKSHRFISSSILSGVLHFEISEHFRKWNLILMKSSYHL